MKSVACQNPNRSLWVHLRTQLLVQVHVHLQSHPQHTTEAPTLKDHIFTLKWRNSCEIHQSKNPPGQNKVLENASRPLPRSSVVFTWLWKSIPVCPLLLPVLEAKWTSQLEKQGGENPLLFPRQRGKKVRRPPAQLQAKLTSTGSPGRRRWKSKRTACWAGQPARQTPGVTADLPYPEGTKL